MRGADLTEPGSDRHPRQSARYPRHPADLRGGISDLAAPNRIFMRFSYQLVLDCTTSWREDRGIGTKDLVPFIRRRDVPLRAVWDPLQQRGVVRKKGLPAL
jgi:hypothetical protein